MDRLYNLFIPGWSAARADNPLLTSLGRRRRVRERGMDWALALGLVVWVGVSMAGSWLPYRFIQPSMLGSSGILWLLIRYPLQFVVELVEFLGLFVALLIILRGALDPAQVEDWAAAPITSRAMSYYVWGRAVGLLLKASLIAVLPLALYWFMTSRTFPGIGDWEWVLFWGIMLPFNLIERLARFYFMMLVIVAILTRRRPAADAIAECGFTAAGIIALFITCTAIIGALVSWIWMTPFFRELSGNFVLPFVLYNITEPMIMVVVIILWGRRIARGAAGRFWEWWLDGPREWRWKWTMSMLLSK